MRRSSTPAEVLLRMLIVWRLYGWSYAGTKQFVGDGQVLRQLCRLGLEQAPDDTALLPCANVIQPATPDAPLDHVVALAHQLQVTRGRKLRVDSTVVRTAIRHPTDSGLLTDAVRTPGCVVRRAQPLAGGPAGQRARRLPDPDREHSPPAARIHQLARWKGRPTAPTANLARDPSASPNVGAPSAVSSHIPRSSPAAGQEEWLKWRACVAPHLSWRGDAQAHGLHGIRQPTPACSVTDGHP